MSLQPGTEDHRIQPMFYGAGTCEFSTHTGSHLYVVVRLDVRFTEAEVAEIQDQIKISANSNQR